MGGRPGTLKQLLRKGERSAEGHFGVSYLSGARRRAKVPGR